MRFLVDMCVDVRVAEWLRRRGHDAPHLRELGLQRLANGAIFEKAAAEGRTVVTLDMDFGEIAALSRGRRASVILLRLRDIRLARVLARLEAVLSLSGDRIEDGVVMIVEDARHRIRRLPLPRDGFP